VIAARTKEILDRAFGPEKEVRQMNKVKARIVLAIAGSYEAIVVAVPEFEAADAADARKRLERRARVEQGVRRDEGEKGARAVYLIDSIEEVAEKGAQQQ
jgi:hypothetical protein